MRIFLLTALTMVAFASNSLLNRAGVDWAGMDPVTFAGIRLAAGAVMLGALTAVLGKSLRQQAGVAGVAALLVYIFGFSLAYIGLDAGLGALILFGMVQITMFAAAILAGEAVPPTRMLGAGIALAGLVMLLIPSETIAVPLLEAGFMAAAGVAWGIYSLAGRGAQDPLAATAANFCWALPVGAIVVLVAAPAGPINLDGVALAIAAGAITSGLGYALWYTVLRDLGAVRGATAQLTVPAIAVIGGASLLGEVVTPQMMLAGGVILTGVFLAR